MSTDSFHSVCSHQSEAASDDSDVIQRPGGTLRILGSSVETWCPERYRLSILDWLTGQDERTLSAFNLYIGVATNCDNNHDWMEFLVERDLERLGVQDEYYALRARLRSPFNGHKVTSLRLATAFPDRALAFRTLFCDKPTMTLSLFKRAAHFTMPALLAFPQAIHLDLDQEMQGYADQFNRHWWLSVNQKDSEVPDCGHFLYKYFALARDNKVALYFHPRMFTDGAQAASRRLFTPPYSFTHLVAYQRLMNRFNESDSDSVLDLEDIENAFRSIDRSQLTALDTIDTTFVDERRDGAVPRLASTSIEYREAKAAMWEAREREAQEAIARKEELEARQKEARRRDHEERTARNREAREKQAREREAKEAAREQRAREREARQQAREKQAREKEAQRQARAKQAREREAKKEAQAREKEARKKAACEAGKTPGESQKTRGRKATKAEVTRALEDLVESAVNPVEERYEPQCHHS